MAKQRIVSAVLCALLFTSVITAKITESEGELEVELEFLEFDLEDQCTAKNEILWKFYRGEITNLTELVEEEVKTANLTRTELAGKLKYRGEALSNKKAQRLLDVLFTTGASRMEDVIFKEFAGFAVDAQANRVLSKIENLTLAQVEDTLRNEKNASVLASTWLQWADTLKYSSQDLTQQISLLTLEAEANGADSVDKYWLSKAELTKIDYEGVDKLWETIVPLYQKLRNLLATHIVHKFGKNVIINPKLIPVHVLGSLDSSDWLTAAEKLEILKKSKTYDALQKSLQSKELKQIYEAADETTADLRLGYLKDEFFSRSQFKSDSKSCVHFMEDFCKQENKPRVVDCGRKPPSLLDFLRAHEEVGLIKHLNQAGREDVGNGFLFRTGPRDSVLYEAISTATSVLGLHPENLRRRNLVGDGLPRDANMTSMLLAALHIIPKLPLHLAYDNWRLTALKAINIEDSITTTSAPTTTTTTTAATSTTSTNSEEDEDEEEEEENKVEEEKIVVTTEIVTTTQKDSVESVTAPVYTRDHLAADWWSVRAKYQGIGSPDNQNYEDFLQDEKVVWNRPHLSKFLGPILMFQILEKFENPNTTENMDLLKQLLRKGKSEPWEKIVLEVFNITELSTEPLLKYFRPLENFFAGGSNFQENSTSAGIPDFKLFLKSTTAGETGKDVVTASEDSHTLMILLIGLASVGAAAVIVSVVRNKIQKKRKERAKRRYGGR